MGKSPSLIATLIVTVLLFAGATYGVIKLKVYLHEKQGINNTFEPTITINDDIENTFNPTEENVRQGNMVFKAAGALGVILLLIYFTYHLINRKSKSF